MTGQTKAKTANVHAMFLFQGFHAGKDDFGDDLGMGQIDAAYHIQHWADRIEAVYAVAAEIQDFPGVFDYEVSEAFGGWLRKNPSAPEQEQVDQLIEHVACFFHADAELTLEILSRMRSVMSAPATV